MWDQHQRYLREQERFDVNPREAFIIDFEQQVGKWQEEGDLMAVCLDANEDVREGPVSDMFYRLGLQEAILTRHYNYSPPATYNRNTQRVPIDGIFISPELQVIGAGYGAFDNEVNTGHRLLWVDIEVRSMFGQPLPYIYYKQAKRFTSKEPKLRRRYNRYYNKLFKEGSGPLLLAKLEKQIATGEKGHIL